MEKKENKHHWCMHNFSPPFPKVLIHKIRWRRATSFSYSQQILAIPSLGLFAKEAQTYICRHSAYKFAALIVKLPTAYMCVVDMHVAD